MDAGGRLGITDLLLTGVLVLALTLGGAVVVVYLLPTARLSIPELEPGVRVGPQTDLPVNGARLVHWGERTILLVRSGEDDYAALAGIAPSDGCLLRWDSDALRVVSPCSNVVYDLRGNVVVGLTTTPLGRYAVAVRDGVIYVTEAS